MDNVRIGRGVFDAIEANDLEAAKSYCAPDMQASRNGGDPVDLDAVLQLGAVVKQLIPDYHYEDISCVATTTGFVEEHRACGTLPDGSTLSFWVCAVADVVDGKIANLREYVDTAEAAPLISALSGG
ncbi:MAG: nuclear transport factor 2 family protein [Pseudomonadota bacterium]